MSDQNPNLNLVALEERARWELGQALERGGLQVRANGTVDGYMSRESHDTYRNSLGAAAKLADQLDAIESLRRVGVIREERVYGPGSPNSWLLDLLALGRHENVQAAMLTDPAAAEAGRRLDRYQEELAHEVRRGSPEGRRAESLVRDALRSPDIAAHRRGVAETRALASGSGATASAGTSASVFVSPYILMAESAPFRQPGLVFASTCRRVDLPPYGMNVYVPSWSSASGADSYTEASSPSEVDPASAFLSGTVKLYSTSPLRVDQQLLDRAGGPGYSFDVFMGEQLQQAVDQQIDEDALTAAVAGANAITGSASFTWASFLQDIGNASEGLTDTAGTRLQPTHVFTISDVFNFAARTLSSSGLPVIPVTSDGAPPDLTGDTRVRLPRNVAWWIDENVPLSSSNNQVVVAAPAQAVVVAIGEPALKIWLSSYAGDLGSSVRLEQYSAQVVRYAAGVSVIAGAAYVDTDK